MALAEIQLKICRFHGSLRQKRFPTPGLGGWTALSELATKPKVGKNIFCPVRNSPERINLI